MTYITKDKGMWFVLALAAVVIASAFFVSDGLNTVDELIYFLGADAFAQSGSLTVENGFETFGSEDLRLWFLIDGPNGLAPQYPPGSAVVGGLFIKLMGVRGMILLNALASAGTLYFTYRLALALYNSRHIAVGAVVLLAFGSFFGEYAAGVWPHAISMFFVVSAFWYFVRALELEGSRDAVSLVFAGLLIGAGFLFRADTILILPTIAATVLLYGARPVATFAWGGLGMIPGFLAAAAANSYKFGSINPLSYGNSSGGGDDPASHLPVLIVVGVVMLALLWARHMTWSPRYRLPFAGVVAGIVALLAVLPWTSVAVKDSFLGAFVLLFDLTELRNLVIGIYTSEYGLLSFWGVAKKALGQSLPWLGILGILVFSRWSPKRRKSHLMILIATAVWVLPFAIREWHGGYSSNMRYFLPIVPFLAIISAALWHDLAPVTQRTVTLGLLAAISGLVAVFAWAALAPTGWAGAQQAMSTYALYAMLLLAMLGGLSALSSTLIIPAVRLGFAACFGMAVTYGLIVDFSVAQSKRAIIADASKGFSKVEGPTLFHGRPEMFTFQSRRPDGLIASASRLTRVVDSNLIRQALKNGYRAFVAEPSAIALTEESVDFQMIAAGPDFEPHFMWEIVLRDQVEQVGMMAIRDEQLQKSNAAAEGFSPETDSSASRD